MKVFTIKVMPSNLVMCTQTTYFLYLLLNRIKMLSRGVKYKNVLIHYLSVVAEGNCLRFK